MSFTNKEVNDHNVEKINKLKSKLYQTDLVGDYPKNYKPKISSHGTIDDTNLSQTLNIKIGARVMIVLNVNTSDSLVNGSLGTILDVIAEEDGTVKCIIVKFDSDKVGAQQRKQHHHIADKYKDKNGTPIFRKKITYHLNGAGKKVHAATATVYQFPMKLAAAITGHKMQGQTVKKGSKVVVNWSNRMPPALAYMMCSRTESVEDLFIAGKFDPKKIRCNKNALEEARRLEEISLTNLPTPQNTNELLGFGFVNIRSLNKNMEHLEVDHIASKRNSVCN